MNYVTWEQYHELNSFECPNFPEVSQEYIYTYPVNWGPIDILELWDENNETYTPKHYSLYVHFPFCKEMCPFCTFCHIPWNEEVARKYIKCLIKEILMYLKHPMFRNVEIHSVYFGGGTPCLIPPDLFSELLKILLQQFPIKPGLEITLECNPLDVSLGVLENAAGAGVNRVSFGIQALCPVLTRALRIKDRDPVGIKALELSRKVGFENVSVDLMYGIPGQKVYDFISDIDNCIELGVTGLSLYWLDTEGSRLEKIIPVELNPKMARDLYYAGRERLLKKGFKQQTPPDFFRGNRCTFVDVAWKAPQGGTVGFGAGAITFFFNGWTYTNVNKVVDYMKLIQEERFPVLGGVQVRKEHLMEKYPILGFRCLFIPIDPFEDIFGVSFTQYFDPALQYLQKLGLIIQNQKGFELTREGLWYVDNVSRVFYGKENITTGQPWAQLLHKVETPPTRRFSELPIIRKKGDNYVQTNG
jgi:oxygen-independent coproporphyrinogen-3 oxidase